MTPFYIMWKEKKVKVLVTQSCATLCHPWTVGHQAPLSTGIVQTIILEGVAIPFSRGSSWLRDWTWASCIAGRFFTIWATKEALCIVQEVNMSDMYTMCNLDTSGKNRELSLVLCDDLKGEEASRERGDTCILTADSLCYRAETNRTL